MVTALIRLAPAQDPLRGAREPVEVIMAEDRVHRADTRHELGCDHLGARAVLGFSGEHEARVMLKVFVKHAVVMIEVEREAITELVDELMGHRWMRA